MNTVNIIHSYIDQINMISGLHNNCTTYYIRHNGHCGNASDDDNNQTKDNHHHGDNHSANQNNDDHDDNGENDHNDNDGDNGIGSDHNHADDNETGSDHNHNDDDDNDGHDQNDIELVLIFLLLLITLLLFHHHLFLVSYHIFVWQIVKCISCVPCLVSRRTRVAIVCIGNKSYHNTFRPSSRLTLVEVLNTNITADVTQRSLTSYYFRRRYSQCIILYNKPFINFVFQASPLCCYSTANYNFQTRFVNMITYNLNLYHSQGNVLIIIMLLNSGEQFIFLSMRRKQKLVLLWQHFPSRFHKISVLILCEVKDDKSCFNIIAMTFQNANSTTNIFIKTLWLKWINNYFLCNCNDATPLLSLRILDMQLHMPEFLTYNLQVIKVQSSIRQTNLNIAIVNNKQTKSSTNCLMIWLRYVCEGQTIDAVKLVTVTVYKLDLHQDASCFQQHNDSMLRSFCNNYYSDVHLMEIQFRILFNRLEMHLFVNTYHFLRELIHEDLELRRIVAINFLSVLLHKVTTEGYETHLSYIIQLLVHAYSQTSLLDSPDEVKMVLECTSEGLRETMKHGSGIYY